jgi:type II secretory pathway component PulF
MSQISSRSLIQLCHRVGTAVQSGIDARRVWEMEERHAAGPLRDALGLVRQQVAAGGTVAEGMQASGFFPAMFVQMVAIGEQTGQLDQVLKRLGEHYEHMAAMRRNFWIGIAWPLFELVMGVLIIGALIFVMGIVGAVTGSEPTDPLGLGLIGTQGAILWFAFCGFIAGGVALFIHALLRGWMGPKPLVAAMRVPVLGKVLESLALSRLTWSLAVALDSGMDARRAVGMSIRAAQNPYYESALQRVTDGIRQNRQFHESFADGAVFPRDFVQQLEAAEEAGATNEALRRLAKEYDQRAQTGMRVLTGIATVLFTLAMMALMVFAIFSLAWHGYIKHLYEMERMLDSGRI